MAGKDSFVSMLWPHALEASKQTGVDPRIIVAQGALESNWGRSAPGNNYFGIKSHGKSGGNTLATTEVVNGRTVKVNDSFRAFGGPEDSVRGYAEFINKNPRYGEFRSAQGLDAQIAALGRSGYATDPNYASKIASIASGLPAPATALGSMAPTSPAATPVVKTSSTGEYAAPAPGVDIPASVQAVADGTSKKSVADAFSLLALQQAQNQPQIAPAQIMGPSADQATALTSFLQSLMQRRA